MTETAIVINSANHSLYQVEILNDSRNCSHCRQDKKCCMASSIITVYSPFPLKKGQTISVEIKESAELTRVLLVFFVPIVFLLTGGILSYEIFFPKSGVLSGIFSLVSFFISILLVRQIEKKSRKLLPYVTGKIESSG